MSPAQTSPAQARTYIQDELDSAYLYDVLAAKESLRIEQLEERREAVRVPVVRRRREKESMLEARGDLANGVGLSFERDRRTVAGGAKDASEELGRDLPLPGLDRGYMRLLDAGRLCKSTLCHPLVLPRLA